MTAYWTYTTQRRSPVLGYVAIVKGRVCLPIVTKEAYRTISVSIDEDISMANPKWRSRLVDSEFTWVVPYTAIYRVTVTGTGGNQKTVDMPLVKGDVVRGVLGNAYEEREEEDPEHFEETFIETIPATETRFKDIVVSPLHEEDNANGHIRVQYTGVIKEDVPPWIVVDKGPIESVMLTLRKRIPSDDYIDNEGTHYSTLPPSAIYHEGPIDYVETNEIYTFTTVQHTTWMPPKEGRVRVLMEGGQNDNDYRDNINGERIVIDMDVTRRPYTVVVGKSGNWDYDADSYKPGSSQFGDVVAHVGPQYPKLLDRHNGLVGYIKITYLREAV